MSNLENLSVLLASQLQARVDSAKPTIDTLISKVEKAAKAAGEAYNVGTFYAPGMDAQASKAKLNEGDNPIQAITVYVGNANGLISKLTRGAYHRLNKQEASGSSYLALYVVDELLRTAVNAKAAVMRMEAAANMGDFADGTVDYDRFERLADKVTKQLVAVTEILGNATTGEDVVKQMAPHVGRRLSANVQRVHDSINKAKAKAKPKTDHAKNVEKSSNAAKAAIRDLTKAVKDAGTTDTDALGTAVKGLFTLRNRFPYYCGMSIEKKKAGSKPNGKKPAKAPKAKQSKQPEQKATTTDSSDAAA